MTAAELQQVLLANLKQSLLWLPVYFTAFAALACVAPNVAGQRLRRAGIGTDLLYWFLTPPVYALLHLTIAYAALAAFGYTGRDAHHRLLDGSEWIAALPFWVQVLGILLLSDILQYWLHRLFHGSALWPFHAVHHSAVEVDWLTSVRFHPVNYLVSFTLPGVLCVVLGVPAQAFLIIGGFNAAFSYLVHANLNWTFGPLRACIASPVFHRWHHTAEHAGLNRNFAPTFPFIDLAFGTFYMPARLPARFGIGDPVPESFPGQLLYPFRRKPQPAGVDAAAGDPYT